MRILIAILPLMLAACERQTPPADVTVTLKVGHYLEGDGRGRFCVQPGEAPQRAVFITFAGEGNGNCSAGGTLRPAGKGMVLIPDGEGDCRIPVDRQGDQMILRPAPAACDYYCGPGVKLGGQTFKWVDTGTADMLAEPLLPDDTPC